MHTLERIQVFLSILVCTFLDFKLGYCIKKLDHIVTGLIMGMNWTIIFSVLMISFVIIPAIVFFINLSRVSKKDTENN